MVGMRLVVGHKGKSKQLALTEDQSKKLRGLKIGDSFKGDDFGLPGYELQIRGGTDKDGFPMRTDLRGAVRKRLLLSGGTGYRPKEKGVRRRKMIRGSTVEIDIAQLNAAVVKAGKKSLEEIFKKEEPAEKAK